MKPEGLVPLIPLFPLLGVFAHALFNRRLAGRYEKALAALPAFASFATTLVLTAELLRLGPADGFRLSLFPWIETGFLRIDLAFSFDALAAVLCLGATGIWAVVLGFASGPAGDVRVPYRSAAFPDFLLFSLLVLSLADNLVLLLAGWAGAGVGAWFIGGGTAEDDDQAGAGMKAFVLNRAADAAFLLAILATAAALRSALLYPGIGPDGVPEQAAVRAVRGLELRAVGGLAPAFGAAAAARIAFLLLLAVVAKSALLPLHGWLLGAFRGSVSGGVLLAAAAVSAGACTVVRLNGFFLEAPAAGTALAAAGALTSLYGAALAAARSELRDVLAGASLSVAGAVFLGLGLGAATGSDGPAPGALAAAAVLAPALPAVLLGVSASRRGRPASGFLARVLRRDWIGEGVEALVVKPVSVAAVALWLLLDVVLVDGVLVNGIGAAVKAAAGSLRRLLSGPAR